MSNSRLNYANWLRDILTSDLSFSALKNEIQNNDKAFVNMLFLTTFRQLTFIKTEVMPKFIKKKIPQKQNILEYILYLGITELLFMDTPSYAIINSYVDVAKEKTDKYGANFVNAILRNVLRNKDDLLKNRKTKYFSNSFIKILKNDYTKKEIEEMEAFVDMEVPLDISIKKDYKHTYNDATKLDDLTLRLCLNTIIINIDGFEEGMIWAQDFASSLAVKCLDDINLEGKKVLDLCAAPGGKTAQLLDRGAKVVAIDISNDRLNRLKENINRLKLNENLNTICANALDIELKEEFDVVLVDAPCSATGTFRRHPEIIHTKQINDIKKQANLQKKILENAKKMVKKGGILVYATCSLGKDEGENQVLDFVKSNEEYSIRPIKIKNYEFLSDENGFLRVLPQRLEKYAGCDGFFVACMQRKI